MRRPDLTFAVMDDDHCAIVKNGRIEETLPGEDEAAMGRAVRKYFHAIEQCGGARQPFAPPQTPAHPHAG